jgi:hypothetical protein
MAAPFIEVLNTVFPVIAINPGTAGEMARADFFGTAFAVGPGVFMTAAHVVANAAVKGQLAIAGPREDQPMLGAARVNDYEAWSDRDVALLFCDAPNVTPLDTWLVERVQLLTDLSSFGFPHAVTQSPAADRLDVVFRAYKGHVITIRGFERLNGSPPVYEISCPFPEGMSGAPLLLNAQGRLAVWKLATLRWFDSFRAHRFSLRIEAFGTQSETR